MFSNYKVRDGDFITDINQLPRCICNPITSMACGVWCVTSFLSVLAASPHVWLFAPRESQRLFS